jgi:hypothetical protein
MDDTQFALGISHEDLRGASMFEMLVRGFAHSTGDSISIEAESVTGNRRRISDQLNVNGPDLHANCSLLLEVFAATSRYGQPPWFGANRSRTKHGCIGGVEFFEKIGSLGREYGPEPGNFRADFFRGYAGHDSVKLPHFLHHGQRIAATYVTLGFPSPVQRTCRQIPLSIRLFADGSSRW